MEVLKLPKGGFELPVLFVQGVVEIRHLEHRAKDVTDLPGLERLGKVGFGSGGPGLQCIVPARLIGG